MTKIVRQEVYDIKDNLLCVLKYKDGLFKHFVCEEVGLWDQNYYVKCFYSDGSVRRIDKDRNSVEEKK